MVFDRSRRPTAATSLTLLKSYKFLDQVDNFSNKKDQHWRQLHVVISSRISVLLIPGLPGIPL